MKLVFALIVLSLGVTMISAQNINISGAVANIPGFGQFASQIMSQFRTYVTSLVDSSQFGPWIRMGLATFGFSNLLDQPTFAGTASQIMRNTANGGITAGITTGLGAGLNYGMNNGIPGASIARGFLG